MTTRRVKARFEVNSTELANKDLLLQKVTDAFAEQDVTMDSVVADTPVEVTVLAEVNVPEPDRTSTPGIELEDGGEPVEE